MKVKTKTEEGLQNEPVPTPTTIEALNEYINSLVDLKHDYGTCVYAMSMAAEATFNFVASKLGVTGFQASCADLDFIRRTRHVKGPMLLLNGQDYLYPQYNFKQTTEEWYASIRDWQRDEAVKLLKDKTHAHASVVTYWKQLAS